MIQITAMHRCIDNQLTNGIRRDFINILAVNPHNGSAQMNIPQNKLKGFLNLFPDRTGILPTVNKNFFGRPLEDATLRCNMKSSAPC